MTRIVVTGAAGYIGGVLTRRLLDDPAVTAVVAVDACAMAHGPEGVRTRLDHPKIRFVQADVRDTATLEPLVAGADAVVHLAAVVGDPAGRRDPETTRAVNVGATLGVVELCAAQQVGHLIFVSTCSNYGMAASDRLMTEDDELAPLSLYAETKVAIERALAERDDVPHTCLRLATVYGVAPRMRLDLTVNQFAVEAYRDRRLAIYGERFWRPYVHVEDVAAAIVLVLSRPDASVGRTFNVGHTDENYTKHMLYELLRERLPDLEAEWVSVTDDPRSYRVAFTRIADELGFLPRYRVPDGLDQVLRLARLGAYADADAPRFRN